MNNFKNLPILFIKFYQVTLSYLIGGNCRFYPSCSNYALESFENYNFGEATLLTAKRICRCHPFSAHRHLYDPVPLKKPVTAQIKTSQKGSI